MFDWIIPLVQLGAVFLVIGLGVSFLTHPIKTMKVVWKVLKKVDREVGKVLDLLLKEE